jgi:membrane protease YdiL (CAAX protease family)
MDAAPRTQVGVVARHPLLSFFVLAYAFSWAAELPLVASAQGWTQRPAPFAFHYLGAYGPLLAAFVTLGLTDGSAGIRRLLGRMVHWRVRPVWWLVAISPLVLYGLSAVALRVLRGAWIDVSVLGRVNYLPDLGLGALALWILNSGVGEETGWRGYALPRLQRGRSALSASLILAMFWVGWHVPAFLYLPTYMQLGFAVLPMFALGIAAGAVFLTWLYNGSQGSLLMAILWHGTFNYVTASPHGDQTVAAIVSAVPIVWAVVVILVWKPATLSPAGKEVL